VGKKWRERQRGGKKMRKNKDKEMKLERNEKNGIDDFL
jgi:hypothetical protein